METDTFDFLNYNFSSLVSIFAALMGLGYPLILQAIQRIDEMYGSARLAAFFRRLWFVRWFQGLLFVVLPVSVAVPFLLRGCPERFRLAIAVGHAVLVFALTVLAFVLFKRIMMTTSPEEFFGYLKKRLNGKHPPLTEIFQILKFASDREDDGLFSKCSQCIEEYITVCRKGPNPDGEDAVWATLHELLRQHSKTDNHFFSSRNLIASYFFPLSERIDLTEEEYRYLWQTVDAVVHADNESWIYSYWTFADQYYRFYLEAYVEGKDYRSQQKRFREQHFMLGALLVYNRKYELLHRLMYFSNTLPKQFALVPSTFCAIYDQLNALLSYENDPQLLTQRYNMIGAPQDVSTDVFIIRNAYRYAALLTIRLFTVNNWNYTFSDPMEVPAVGSSNTIEKLDAEIFKMNRLKGEVQEWYKNRETVASLVGPEDVKMEDVLTLCDKYIDRCKRMIEDLKSSTAVDPNKREYIKTHLLAAMKDHPLTLPLAGTSTEGYKEFQINNYLQIHLDNEMLKVGTSINASNLPDVIAEHMNKKVYAAYNQLFLTNSSTQTFPIAYKDLKKVINALNDREKIVVLSLGVYLGNYERLYGKEYEEAFQKDGDRWSYRGCEIYSIPSTQQCFIVMLKAELPFVRLHLLKDAHGLDLIDEQQYLYSNIDSIRDLAEESSQQLRVDRGIRLYAKGKFQCVKLTVDFNSRVDTDLEGIVKAVASLKASPHPSPKGKGDQTRA